MWQSAASRCARERSTRCRHAVRVTPSETMRGMCRGERCRRMQRWPAMRRPGLAKAFPAGHASRALAAGPCCRSCRRSRGRRRCDRRESGGNRRATRTRRRHRDLVSTAPAPEPVVGECSASRRGRRQPVGEMVVAGRHHDHRGSGTATACLRQRGAATCRAGHQPRSARNSANSCCVNVTSEFLQTAIVGKVASRSLMGWRTRPLRKMFSAHVV